MSDTVYELLYMPKPKGRYFPPLILSEKELPDNCGFANLTECAFNDFILNSKDYLGMTCKCETTSVSASSGCSELSSNKITAQGRKSNSTFSHYSC